ncbi:type IV pilus modification protein PilV [Motiliproteus sediminis]|uniref:type IV pilus modification protein PilV n=1 Tax=Motiliproteus sediminis TaxID=1468178 RepID=UPI001AF0056F
MIKKHQTGFTLVEILVAVLVLSVGILGLVGLESLAMQSNQEAYFRSQATLLSYELADRMRANPSTDYSTVTPASHGCVSYTGAATSCSSLQVAEEDVLNWQAAIAEKLPAGTGSISASGSLLSVNVLWDSNRNGSPDQTFSIKVEL